ncbi:P-loop NTPase fold protein [Acinetobacter sp. YH12251]|uniref:KAP family P-loop NTPase fold protein n=1 Tax=Acinetobacter sp. YH12251 TaxID=2601176 RepID=UPI00359FBF7D
MMNNQLNLSKDSFENIETAWEGDLWHRRRLGEQLTNYVDRLNCGAVLALDARWGEGKTWFVRHWAKHLTDTEHNVVYLDAFANDYLEDPFLTIAAEISQTFKESKEIDDNEIKDFNAKTASVLISLAAVIPMIAAKAGMHLIGLGGAGEAFKEVYEEGKELYDTASEEIAAKVKEKIEKKIENHQVEKQTIHDFKKELAVLAGKLDKPLVFIIDELDRCRPDFAIRLIERIKHFFDIPKIFFVLVMNKPQLLQSVKSYYGYDSEMNGDYLEKFLDFTIKFPNLDNSVSHKKIIKDQLFRVGEISTKEGDSELYFWIMNFQITKQYNSRELIKKINQYALLRTDNPKLNLILCGFIFDDLFELTYPYLTKQIHNLYNCFEGTDNMYMTKSYFINQKIVEHTNIKNSLICEIYDAIESLENNYKTQGQQGQKESAMSRILNQYCVGTKINIKNFKDIWKQYIKTGLFEVQE